MSATGGRALDWVLGSAHCGCYVCLVELQWHAGAVDVIGELRQLPPQPEEIPEYGLRLVVCMLACAFTFVRSVVQPGSSSFSSLGTGVRTRPLPLGLPKSAPTGAANPTLMLLCTQHSSGRQRRTMLARAPAHPLPVFQGIPFPACRDAGRRPRLCCHQVSERACTKASPCLLFVC